MYHFIILLFFTAASTKLSWPQRWGLRVDRWYTPEGSLSGPPPLNEKLRHQMQNRDLLVTISWRLAIQIEGVLSGLVDITSWIHRVLGAFAGLSSKASQQIFNCLTVLAKANLDIIQPSEMLWLRMLLLRQHLNRPLSPKLSVA